MIRILFFYSLYILFLTACDRDSHHDAELQKGQKPITLRFGHDMAEASAHHLGALYFADLVNKRSNGRLKIDIFPAHALGSDHKMLAMALSGELDIILPPTAKLSTIDPAMQILDLPYLFSSKEEARRVLDGELGQTLLKRLQTHGLVGLGFWESSFKQLTANRAITSASDFKNLRFRIMRSRIIRDQFNSWGAKSLAINFTETYQALAEKIVDAQENPLGSIFNMKFHEVQRNLILSNHGYLAQVLSISAKTFDRLPMDLQEIIIVATVDASLYQRQQAEERESYYLAEIKKSGISIAPATAALQAHMKKSSNSLKEKNRFIISTEIIELAEQVLNENKTFSENELVIGLDADLAGHSALSGLSIKRGIEIAIHEINNKGGVLGKKLVLISRDNSIVSARGIKNLEKFSTIPNLVAVFGGISSPVVLSELPLVHEKKILFLDSWAAATSIIENNYKPNYVFRLSVRDEEAAPFLLKQALGVSSKIGLLLSNNDWGRSNHNALMNAMTQKALKPTYLEWFDWGTEQHDVLIERMYQSGAEVIIYVGNVVEAASFVQEIARKNKKMPVISHWGITGGRFAELAGAALDKVDVRVLQTFSFIDNKSSRARSVFKLYKQLYGIDSELDIVAPTGTAHAYDMTHLLAKAIKQAASADMQKIHHTLERLGKYDGLVRTYNPPFTPKNHEALDHRNYFMSVYKNGKLIPLRKN